MSAKKSYDKIAKDYDGLFNNKSAKAEDEYIIKKCIEANNSDRAFLDMGCGTGLFLDYVETSRYIGFDISQGMINEAWKKHPSNIFYVASIEDELKNTRSDMFPISLFGSFSYVHPEYFDVLNRIFDHYLIMFFKDGYVPVTHTNFNFECKFYQFSDYKIPEGCKVEEFNNYMIVTR